MKMRNVAIVAHDAHIDNDVFVQTIVIVIDDKRYAIDVSSTIDRLQRACVDDDMHNINIHCID